MKSTWTAGLTKEKSKEITSDFVGSFALRSRLVHILTEKTKGANKEARSKGTYENPNWAYLQADLMGYERALYEIISLISENDVDN